MSEKFQRQYDLRVEKWRGELKNGLVYSTEPSSYLVIPKDLTLELSITRAAWGESQQGSFTISNLSEKTRTSIFKDEFDGADCRGIQLRAGYKGKPMPLVFAGTIISCQSNRQEGAREVLTEIKAFDGGYAMANGTANLVIPAGTKHSEVIKSLASTMPCVSSTIIGNFPKFSERPVSLVGNSWDLIKKYSNGKAYIDNGQLVCLNDDEVIEYSVTLDDRNILGAPRRSQALVELDILFEPSIACGIKVVLKSSTNKYLNGTWKVFSVRHQGVISPTQGGKLITTVTLWNNGSNLKAIAGKPIL